MHLGRTQMSHLGLRTPQVERMAAFYEDALGLCVHGDAAGGGLRLGWGRGHYVLELLPGDAALDHYGLEIRDEGALDELRSRLDGATAPLDELDGFEVRDPDGNRVQLHGRVDRSGENEVRPGRRPTRMQHITVASKQVPAVAQWYVETLGFRVSDTMGDAFMWLRCGPEHHTVAAVDSGAAGGMDHYAYEIASWEDFKLWCDRLSGMDVPIAWGPGRHGPGNNLFIMFDDPDGNHVELSAELENFWDDTASYDPPRNWVPGPRTTNLWGGPPAPWRV
jgi:catechol 2,3-dioxygenase